MWGVANVMAALGVSDRCLDDGGRIGCEYVTHGDPTLVDEEGPVPIEEQVYPEPVTNRELHVSILIA